MGGVGLFSSLISDERQDHSLCVKYLMIALVSTFEIYRGTQSMSLLLILDYNSLHIDCCPVHATTEANAHKIVSPGGRLIPGGLKRSRVDVHFALHQPDEVGPVRSGILLRQPIWLFLNLESALQHGRITFGIVRPMLESKMAVCHARSRDRSALTGD